MAEQVILEFVGDPSGLKPLADAYKALGALTDEQIEDFKKANETFAKRTAEITKQTSETKKLNNELSKEEKTIASLAAKSKEIPKAIAGKEIKEAVNDFAKVGVEIDNANKKSVSLKAELRALKEQLAQLDEGTVEFENLAQRAAQLEDQIGDVNERVRVLASDTFKFDAAVDAIRGITAAFSVAQGAAALFGDESEELQKALLKVQGATALLTGVQEIANQVTGQGAGKLFILNAAQKTNAFLTGISTRAVTFFGTASTAAWAAATLGISLLIAGLVTLVSNWDKLTAAVERFIGVNQQSNDVISDSIKLNDKQNAQNNVKKSQLEFEIELLKLKGESQDKILKKEIELNKFQIKANLERINQNKILINEFEKEEKATQSIIITKKDLQKVNSNLENENKKLNASIEGLNKQLTELSSKAKKAAVDMTALAKEIAQTLEDELGSLNLLDIIAKDLDDEAKKKALQDKIQKTLQEVYNNIPEEFIESEKDLPITFRVRLQTDKQFRQEFINGLKETALQATQLISDTIFEANRERREREFQQLQEDLNMDRDMELNNEDLTEAQRLAIQEKYRRQEAAIKLQQWRKEQSSKATQAIINGSLAATLAIATIPPPGGQVAAFQNILFAGIQAAAILAKKPPAFAKGTKNAPEGMALVGEEGPELVHLKGGSKVITAPETKKILDKYQVPNIVKYDDVVKDSQGMNIIGIDPDAVAKAVAKEIAKQDRVSINIDEKGFVKYLLGQRNKTELINRKFKMN